MKFSKIGLVLLVWCINVNAQVYVSPNGSDMNTGTKEQPFATLQKAIRYVRELRRTKTDSLKQDVHIILRDGIYSISETIVFRPEDGMRNQSTTFIEAAPNEKPILSGGVKISNWKKVGNNVIGLNKNSASKIWVADVPQINGNELNFRQLWVNDEKATRAKDTKGELMNRIISWNKKEETCMIPTSKFNIQNIDGLEMFIHQWWAIANLRIKKMQVMGDSTKLFFHQPESKIQSEHPWPAPWISKETGNSAFYLNNAIEFLDEPGEWYLDKKNHKLYYYPRTNENMQTANVVAPYLETLISIEGTNEMSVENNYVRNLSFKGISFQYTNWLRPTTHGHIPHQVGMYMTEAYKLKPKGTKSNPTLDNQAWIGKPTAALEVKYGARIFLENCKFEHLSSTAINLNEGTSTCSIKGSLFKDIGGNGIVAGNFGEEGREIHIPYDVDPEHNQICRYVWITNNLFTNIGNEDWSCVAIASGFAQNITIQNNEIENVPYSGISLGWGWTYEENVMRNNLVNANKIHHFGMHNYDCAGVYTQSTQGDSEISENYIDSTYKAPYAHLPSHWFYLYADEGSSGLEFINNWTPSIKYLKNTKPKATYWDNNGPDNNDSVKLVAGIQKKYQHLLQYKTPVKKNYAINENHKEIIEIISNNNSIIDLEKLKQILVKSNVDTTSIFQWNNHTVIYDYVQDVGVLQERLQNNFPNTIVKVYYDIVYDYQKQKHCKDKSISIEWNHILLTANLVKDEKLQQEYVDYHKTQFEKWPEVSQGFCNANLQQLLVFKNGRQLMLVISIPKGESLDKINPKTTENNPRMNDWNKIMGKYQEGIEGTKKGETWVFLKKL